jgi:2-haloacid dehalogenase
LNNNKTIVFDLGGVLIDWDPRHLFRKLFPDQEEMEFFLRTICSPAWNAQMDSGYPFEVAVAELSAQYPEYLYQIQAYYDRWEEMILGSFPETIEILEELKAAGYHLAALSNWSAETLPRVAVQFPFLDWFNPLVLSGGVKMVKPDPEIYHHLLNELKRPPGECIFIDDSYPNIQTAEELGFQSIHYSSAEQLREELVGLDLLSGSLG